MTQMGLDIEAIEHLDFEANLVCESLFGCDRPVAWRFVLSCCGRVFLMCDPCKVAILQEMADFPDQTVECRFCLSRHPYGKTILSMERL